MAGCVCGSREIIAHSPEGEVRDVKELDESAGFGAPAGEEAVEFGVSGGEDPLVVAFPGGVFEVRDYDV